jgi:indole-3-glycerol phosphate synthase
MNNNLAPIIAQKKREVAALYQSITHSNHPLAQILSGKQGQTRKKSFKKALRGINLSIIAEIKRKSPSKGLLATIENPILLAEKYLAGGANALSILTDELFFGGNLNDLTQAAQTPSLSDLPILRKDFIIDEIQIAQAIQAGADAILCIVAVLGNKTKKMIDFAKSHHIDALVEVHDAQELEIAINSNADIIGVNNRNLDTFMVDPARCLQLVEHIPSSIIRVAESGILSPQSARNYYQAGFDAVLIGEALVTASNPEKFIQACQYG